MIEERFESYVYQIMKYVKYQENKPYIESILEEMRYTLFREDREYIKELEQRIDKAIEYLKQDEVRVIYQELGLQPMRDNDTLLEILGGDKDE